MHYRRSPPAPPGSTRKDSPPRTSPCRRRRGWGGRGPRRRPAAAGTACAAGSTTPPCRPSPRATPRTRTAAPTTIALLKAPHRLCGCQDRAANTSQALKDVNVRGQCCSNHKEKGTKRRKRQQSQGNINASMCLCLEDAGETKGLQL